MEPQKPAKNTTDGLRRAHTVAQTGNLSHRGSRKAGRVRANSLRRTNNGNESSKQPSLDSPGARASGGLGTRSDGRDGSYFTVGNVGHNGKIYLRPMGNKQQTRNQTPGYTQPGPSTPKPTYLTPHTIDRGARHSIWSSSQLSELRPTPIREDSAESRLSLHRESPAPDEHDKRRHSFSDIDDRLPSATTKPHRELRIVIDRPKGDASDDSSVPVPELEIPIPHCRLGGFKFTPDGEPVLRSSAHTRTSISDHLRSSSMKVDPGVMLRRRSNDQSSTGSQSFVFPMFPASRSLSGFNTAPTQSSVFYRLKEPIEPSIFDSLSSQMDAASVVRYLSGTHQITAATPARIVAQISSDSFMDYELVSDFFLTFRCYLSLSNLLSLLLARLQWAIDRLEDDGRIIRIRVFAALRHWILNYFVDDFVGNRDLRVQFCDRINRMYDDVKNRNSERASDLKIVVDLKRCWNGRCSLYWENPQFLNDTHPDNRVLPGGNDATTASMHSGRPHSRPQGANPPPAAPRKFGAGSVSAGPPTTSAGPGWQRAFHAHKRSGSFSDSFRDDRAPLPSSDGYGQPKLEQCDYPDSIIRGNVYSPLESHVTAMDPPSPTFEVEHLDIQPADPSKPDDPTKGVDPAGKKNFIASIRKVLHSRQNCSQGGGPASPPRLRGRTSTLPSNVAVGSETHKNRRAGSHSKGPPRLDLLGEETLRSYQNLIVTVSQDPRRSAESRVSKSDSNQKDLSSQTPRLEVHSKDLRGERLASQMTTGSKSIVIVDDTGPSMHFMTGALQPPSPAETDRPNNSSVDSVLSPTVASSHEYGSQLVANARESGTPHRSSSLPRKSSKPTVVSLSDRFRKYTSYHGNAGARNLEPENGRNSGESVSRTDSFRKTLKPLARMLRRRPGGDLRKMQNAGSLSARHSMASFVSATSNAESGQESVLYMGGVERESESRHTSLPPRKPYSLMQDRSTQHMRPSFEAAVEGFSKLPDDDDGGIESTLLKLEGRWAQKPRESVERSRNSRESRLRQVENSENEGVAYSQRHQPGPAYGASQNIQVTTAGAYTDSYIASESSYCSIPLLERGLGDDSMRRRPVRQTVPDATIPRPLPHQGDQPGPDKEPSHPSVEVVEKTQNLKQIAQESTAPKTPPASHPPTADDETDEGISEISSDISVEIIGGTEVAGGDGVGLSPSVKFASLGVPAHPLIHPDSPPRMMQEAPAPMTHPYSGVYPTHRQSQPISPDSMDTAKVEPQYTGPDYEPGQSQGPRFSIDMRIQDPSSALSNHVPFILGYDSRTLAQQFTLVEQGALGEIDWRDLVEMRWSDASQSTLNWVEYLAEEERRGIDLVVARFNLMVKWAVSQVVLTKNVTERAQVVTKLIHVAVHARKLCNYATMLQITIALSSVDCTRLTKTWELVAEGEKRLLRDMEPLVQPVRNFQKLRTEMEDSTLQNGCIPFVGLYVQDLTYNSQKPAQIASTRDGEPLVNFERYRTAATIVKSLLRLIDASSKYTFEAVHGVVERCLWTAALPDEKIMSLSKSLE